MNTAGEAFSAPFRDPQWLSKILVQGLINLIPIVGQIALSGWILETMDNYRQGRQELAPYGFYLSRGLGLFAPVWVSANVFGLLLGLIVGMLSVAAHMDLAIGQAIDYVIAGMAACIYVPALVVNVAYRGMGGGFAVGQIFSTITRNASATALVAALWLVATVIAYVGVFRLLRRSHLHLSLRRGHLGGPGVVVRARGRSAAARSLKSVVAQTKVARTNGAAAAS